MIAPARYGSREWVRRLPPTHRPVGALNGLVVVSFDDGQYAVVIGGSPEAPTLEALPKQRVSNIVWAVSAPENVTGAATTDPSRDEGAGATPWIFGGLLIAAAFGVAAMEKKMPRSR